MKTYDEILESMKAAFFAECGRSVEHMGDICARFEAVASELFSLSCSNDFLLRQAFPQSATGEYLDRHAAMRDIVRKQATKAAGTLTFSISQAASAGISIPAGTVCSVPEHPYIQYATDEACTIARGELSVTVAATALEPGSRYNCAPDSITVMVNPPGGVERVANGAAFVGGNDAEDDNMLRRRVMDSFRLTNGVSREHLEGLVLSLDFIRDCKISHNGDGVRVRIVTDDGTLTDDMCDSIKDKLMLLTLAGESITILPSQPEVFPLTVTVKGGNASAADIESALRAACSALRIDENVEQDYLEYLLAGYGYCRVKSSVQTHGTILCPQGKHLVLGDCEVLVYD